MVLKQCGHCVTIALMPFEFHDSTFIFAIVWYRYSLPPRRANSALQVSSLPSVANFTPASPSTFATARDTFFMRSS